MIIKFSGAVEVEDKYVDKFFGPRLEALALQRTEPVSAVTANDAVTVAEAKTLEKPKKPPTAASLKKRAAKLVNSGKVDELTAILHGFKIATILDLDKDRWSDLAAQMDEVIAA